MLPSMLFPAMLARVTRWMIPLPTFSDTGAAGLTCLAPLAGAASSLTGGTTGDAMPGDVRSAEPASDSRGPPARPGATAAKTPPTAARTHTAATARIFVTLPRRRGFTSGSIVLILRSENNGPGALRRPGPYVSVTIVLRLVGAGCVDVQVFSLVLGQLGKLHAQGVQVQARHLFVQDLGQDVHLVAVLVLVLLG